ncbi:MAG: hypothetical protein CSB47_03335 [Proteobacteria bacterium]|nr:MAG: hypothetical protein CSB47_03335 [Pseudomonadota bacterium]
MNTSELPSLNLKTIMAGQKQVILKHGNKPYLLSITRRGKLILTAAEFDGAEEIGSTQPSTQ